MANKVLEELKKLKFEDCGYWIVVKDDEPFNIYINGKLMPEQIIETTIEKITKITDNGIYGTSENKEIFCELNAKQLKRFMELYEKTKADFYKIKKDNIDNWYKNKTLVSHAIIPDGYFCATCGFELKKDMIKCPNCEKEINWEIF